MARRSFAYGDEQFEYVVFFTPERKDKIAIHVHPDASVQVDAPEQEPFETIQRAVLKRARWIKKNVDKARAAREHVLPRSYVSGESFFYLGRRYPLKVLTANGMPSSVKLFRGRIEVLAPVNDPAAIRRRLRQWYRERASDVFARRFEAVVDQVTWLDAIPAWRTLAMQKQWGSCSPEGTILLNPQLVKAPRDCVDYVIMHELCHLLEHNHSPRYYRLLGQLMPGWEPVKARLDGMAELLLNE